MFAVLSGVYCVSIYTNTCSTAQPCTLTAVLDTLCKYIVCVAFSVNQWMPVFSFTQAQLHINRWMDKYYQSCLVFWFISNDRLIAIRRHHATLCYIYLEIKRWVAEKGMIKSQLHTNFYHFCIRSLRQNMLCSIFTSCNMFQNHLKLMVSRRHVSKIIYHMPNSWTWFVICNVLITYFAQAMSPHLSIYLSVHA